MSDVALYVGGPLDGQRRAVPVHSRYFIHPVRRQTVVEGFMEAMRNDPTPVPTYREERYIQTGIGSGHHTCEDHVRVYIYEPLLLENPSRHATEVAFGMLIEGYRNPRCI